MSSLQGATMLANLIYVSVRKSGSDDNDIEDILAASRRNNAPLNITGILLHSDTHFFQYIEGDEETLDLLYDKIKRDQRHSNVILIAKSAINERNFPTWQMGGKRIDQDKIQFNTTLSENEQDEFRAIVAGKKLEGTRATNVLRRLFGEELVREVS